MTTGVGSRLIRILLALILVVLIAGAVFLGVWSPEPPSAPVERVIPDARFPH